MLTKVPRERAPESTKLSSSGFIQHVTTKITGLLSNQGEKSINVYFIMVPLRKSIKVWYSKAQIMGFRV